MQPQAFKHSEAITQVMKSPLKVKTIKIAISITKLLVWVQLIIGDVLDESKSSSPFPHTILSEKLDRIGRIRDTIQ